MLTPIQVANFFLKKNDPEAGDLITNLKIQKLVYYAQGFYLAMYDTPLFEEEILAWEHGPVVESLYYKFREFGSSELPIPETVDLNEYSEEEKDLLNEVFNVYGQFSAWKLRNMTHSERPWTETQKNEVIPKGLMAEYFKTQLN